MLFLMRNQQCQSTEGKKNRSQMNYDNRIKNTTLTIFRRISTLKFSVAMFDILSRTGVDRATGHNKTVSDGYAVFQLL